MEYVYKLNLLKEVLTEKVNALGPDYYKNTNSYLGKWFKVYNKLSEEKLDYLLWQ